MLGLPKSTELNKQLPKKAIFTTFQLSTAEKAKIDADIAKISIVNEVSAARLNIADGEKTKSFFVLLISLKKREFDEKTVVAISKLIDQNLLFILAYEGEAKLATHHLKLMQTEWRKIDELSIELNGLNMDTVWENIIAQIGDIQVSKGTTLDEQIAINEQRAKIEREIETLTKRSRAENQPKKKFELAQKINKLRENLDKL